MCLCVGRRLGLGDGWGEKGWGNGGEGSDGDMFVSRGRMCIEGERGEIDTK